MLRIHHLLATSTASRLFLRPPPTPPPSACPAAPSPAARALSTTPPPPPSPSDHIPAEQYLASFVNYEQQGIPNGAGVDAGGEFDLQRMRQLLQVLGDPQDELQVVHLAGSKGKGSTAVLLSSILRAAGLRVGLYTSPHLHHVTERISTLHGTPLAHQQLEALVHHSRAAIDPLRADPAACPSHFEVLTALALRHFANEKVDLAVVEAGLGGLTDATNVFRPSNLAAAVITPIGEEHVDALGGSLGSIAAAKAGILKAGRPLVLAPQPHAAAEKVLLEAASQLGCEVTRADEVVHVASRGIQLPVSSSSSPHEVIDITLPTPTCPPSTSPPSIPHQLQSIPMKLIGSHQHTNTATAVATALLLRRSGLPVSMEAIREGLASAELPGRFQVMRLQQDASAAASGVERGAKYVVLDGAHTAESAAALVESLRSTFPDNPLAFVVAMAADKDHRAVVAALRRAAPCTVVFTSVAIAGSYSRAAPPGTLAAQWQAAAFLDRGRPIRCRELIQASLAAAFEKACHELRAFDRDGVVCVTGSLHAVAAATRLVS